MKSVPVGKSFSKAEISITGTCRGSMVVIQPIQRILTILTSPVATFHLVWPRQVHMWGELLVTFGHLCWFIHHLQSGVGRSLIEIKRKHCF